MKVKKLHGLGNHLIIDGYSEGELSSIEFFEKFLEELVDKLEMRKISEPMVLYHHAEDKCESGITGAIMMAESSIVIHTYPEKKFICLDIFSCNEFDLKIMDYLKDKLKLISFEKKLIIREAK